MSITKHDDLNFEREFPVGDYNDTHEIKFNKKGIEIDYDTISWDEIKKAYTRLFGKDL